MSELKTTFKGILRTLTDSERTKLEELLLKEGIRDEIVVWNGMILDGNSRYDIAKKHNLPFKTRELSFPDEHAAKAWMYKTQMARRNAAPDYIEYCLGMELKEQKQSSIAAGKLKGSAKGALPGKTSERIAKEHKISARAVEYAQNFADGVNTAEEAVPGIKEAILSGNSPTTRTTLRNVGKLKGKAREEFKERVAKSIESGSEFPKPRPKTMGDLYRKHGLKVEESPEPLCSTPLNVVRNAMDDCMACPMPEYENYLREPKYHLGQKWVKEKLFSRYGKWFSDMAEKFENQTKERQHEQR